MIFRSKRSAERSDAPAYNKSAVAAPRPMIRPRRCPSACVLRIHIIPTGPIGTAIANPTISPFRKKIGSMFSCSDQLIVVDMVRIGVEIFFNFQHFHAGIVCLVCYFRSDLLQPPLSCFCWLPICYTLDVYCYLINCAVQAS
jgi:hypothetical protein